MQKNTLILTAVVELATGVLLLAWPPIFVRLLIGTEIGGAGLIMSRIAGIALISLSVSCWPGDSAFQQLHGMLTYNMLATLYLGYIGLRGDAVGWLLWPVVVVHAIFVVLLLAARFKKEKTRVA